MSLDPHEFGHLLDADGCRWCGLSRDSAVHNADVIAQHAELRERGQLTPTDVIDRIMSVAKDLLTVALLQLETDLPPEQLKQITSFMAIGVAAASEYYAKHPEHLAMAHKPQCEVCGDGVMTWQVGVDPAADHTTEVRPVKIAWPCGHYQKVE